MYFEEFPSLCRGMSSSGAKGPYAPDESNQHAPNKIRNSMFLPLMKKARIGGICQN